MMLTSTRSTRGSFLPFSCCDGGDGERIAGRRLFGVVLVAIARVALEADARAALPGAEAERPRAHRVLHDAVAVELDDLARHRTRHRRVAEVVGEARVRHAEPELDRVAVERAQALDFAVVIERLALQRRRAHVVDAEQLVVLERGVARALPARVEVALDRIHVVGRGELAAHALEGRIVGEVDPRPQPHGEGLEVRRGLRHGRRRVRLQPHRAGEEFVGVERVEDVGDERRRIEVGDLRRVEAGLGDAHGIAQDLGRRRCLGPGRRCERHRRLPAGSACEDKQRQSAGGAAQAGVEIGSGPWRRTAHRKRRLSADAPIPLAGRANAQRRGPSQALDSVRPNCEGRRATSALAHRGGTN